MDSFVMPGGSTIGVGIPAPLPATIHYFYRSYHSGVGLGTLPDSDG